MPAPIGTFQFPKTKEKFDQKTYHKQWRKENPDKVAADIAKTIAKRQENPALYKAYLKEWRRKNKNSKINRALYDNHGISLDIYDQMFAKQNGVCAICFQPEKSKRFKNMAVDHDHKTGKIRGLLCRLCNTGIGHLKDDIEILESAIKYLKESRI